MSDSTSKDRGAQNSKSAGPKAQSKTQVAYSFIKQGISDGTYTPGFRLVLGQIAANLNVSVVPVREAIRLLQSEGLVTYEVHVGAQVAMFDETEYQFTMQTLSIVEGAATALSAPQVTASDIARARAVNERMAASLRHLDPMLFTALNLEFHSILFEHCSNPHILDLVNRGWARLRALRGSTFSFVPGRAQESVEEHEALLQLIENGANALDVELAARRHRTATLDAFLEYQKHARPHPSYDIN